MNDLTFSVPLQYADHQKFAQWNEFHCVARLAVPNQI